MGSFDGIEHAPTQIGSNYARDGHYLLRVDTLRTGQSRTKGGFWLLKATVVKVFPDIEARHRLGEQIERMVMQSKPGYLPEMKALVCALTGVADSQVTSQEVERCCGPQQPLAGIVFDAKLRAVETQASQQARAFNPQTPPRFFTKMDYGTVVRPDELQQVLTAEEMQALNTPAPPDKDDPRNMAGQQQWPGQQPPQGYPGQPAPQQPPQNWPTQPQQPPAGPPPQGYPGQPAPPQQPPQNWPTQPQQPPAGPPPQNWPTQPQQPPAGPPPQGWPGQN